MSAFVCHDHTLAAVIGYGIDQKLSFYHPAKKYRVDFTDETANEIGQILVNENQRSVNACYPKRPAEKPDTYKHKTTCRLTAVEAIKLCHCINYQMESDDDADPAALAILTTILYTACTKLAGYDAAPWGVASDAGLTHAGTIRL